MDISLERIFTSVLNMSITASVVIAAVILIRLFLKKAPKIISYTLWFVVLFRLLCPFSIESAFSFFAFFNPDNAAMDSIPASIGYMAQPQVDAVIPAITKAISTSLPPATPESSINPMQVILGVLTFAWVTGVFTLLIHSAASYLRLKDKSRTAILIKGNVYQSDRIESPLVCGFIKPKIYLPVHLSPDEREYIICHEQVHVRRCDYLIKPLWFFALCLHWFNPLVWLAFRLMSKDMEMSCDEAVLRKMGEGVKVDYSSSLLTLAVQRRLPAGSPLAFGETNTRQRVKNILGYRNHGVWITAAGLVAVIAASLLLGVNPKNYPGELSLAQKFISYKTPYVGNNSKVGGIISLLEFPDKARYDSFALKTDAEPYGVTVKLMTDTFTKAYYTDSVNQQQFEHNAVLMLSLINNVEEISFKLDDGHPEDALELTYTRPWADGSYGRDVREFARSGDELQELLKLQAMELTPSYSLMKFGKDGKILVMRSPLNGEKKELAEEAIFNYMIKSAALPGIDISSLDEYYLIKVTYSDGSFTDYYVFKLYGYACMQLGKNGMYSRISDRYYTDLAKLLDIDL